MPHFPIPFPSTTTAASFGLYFISPPTHPFLPYVAPHFSHISPFILVFLEPRYVPAHRVAARERDARTASRLQEEATVARAAASEKLKLRLSTTASGAFTHARSSIGGGATSREIYSRVEWVLAGGEDPRLDSCVEWVGTYKKRVKERLEFHNPFASAPITVHLSGVPPS